MIKNNRILKPLLSSIFIFVLLFSFTLNVLAENKTEETVTPPPQKVAISFNTMGGSEVDTIYGYAGQTQISEDMLPIPTKEGYTFKGWRHFNEYGMPFELTVFPNYDITLIASFEPNGFAVTFEEGISEVYDINSGVELYAPDTKKYSKDKVKEGWRCLRTKKNSAVSPMFLLSYHNALEEGTEYEITINIKSESIGAKGSVEFLYAQNPDIRDKSIGYHKAFDLAKAKKGQWQEYKIKFFAAAPYVFVRLPSGSNLYIDDIKLEPTGKTGGPTALRPTEELNKVSASQIYYIITASILLGFSMIYIVKRTNQNKNV